MGSEGKHVEREYAVVIIGLVEGKCKALKGSVHGGYPEIGAASALQSDSYSFYSTKSISGWIQFKKAITSALS